MMFLIWIVAVFVCSLVFNLLMDHDSGWRRSVAEWAWAGMLAMILFWSFIWFAWYWALASIALAFWLNGVALAVVCARRAVRAGRGSFWSRFWFYAWNPIEPEILDPNKTMEVSRS
ncbi:MAG: hypothetical protein SFZ23_08595 [Planctomycetota bacterium]|nr:hypothetical protein [Planctomycetota bacterium]